LHAESPNRFPRAVVFSEGHNSQKERITMTRPNEGSTKRVRRRSLLSSETEKHLCAYAVAAGSAGVALLACAQPAEAKIVATRTNISIDRFGTSVPIDINGDGQNDFSFTYLNFRQPSGTCTSSVRARDHQQIHRKKKDGTPPLGCGIPFNLGLQVNPLQETNEVWQMAGTQYGHICAFDVRKGVAIGPARRFEAGAAALSGIYGTSEGAPFCPWRPTSQAHSPYLAVKFVDIEGKLHYGWVRVVTDLDYNPVIDAYAYETVPNKPIPAGALEGDDNEATAVVPAEQAHHASLGWLAAGASGIAVWRKEEEEVAA
jgi:hypothetical protein